MKPRSRFRFLPLGLALLASAGMAGAGPYSGGFNDPTNIYDAPVPGFIGPDGEGRARLDDGQGEFINPDNVVNPLFFGWAVGFSDYLRADGEVGGLNYADPTLALGPVTGDNFDVVSLGDLSAAQISGGLPAGKITLQMTNAVQTRPMSNLPGADFVVFENSFVSANNTGGAGIGGVLSELAYVEVSSDGVNFARFKSTSLTPSAVGPYGSVNPTNIYNLAGKHVNAYGECWGTPFDLADLATDPLVQTGTVNLTQIRYVRLVDIPGNGSYFDAAPAPHPIYDTWRTFGSGGLDLEAVGVISMAMTFDTWQDAKGLTGTQRGANADPDHDGVENLVEYACAMEPLKMDIELLPKAVLSGGSVALQFRRDTRGTDVRMDVQVAESVKHPWVSIARSQGGAPFQPLATFTPVISDTSASHIATVGVVRKQIISLIPGYRMLRISVSLTP